MEQKLSWAELRNQVANRTGLSQKDTNTLLRAGLDCIMEALKAGDTVRLGDLGTFRTQTMAPRKSVDVNTGESIILDSYQRVNFTPSDMLKAVVNDEVQPKLTPDNDPLRKLSTQADEIIDILGEMGQGPKAKEKEEEAPFRELVSPVSSGDTEPSKGREVSEGPEKPEEPVMPVIKEEPAEPEKPARVKEEKRPFRPWLTAGITILVFCLFLLLGYFFLQHKIEQWANELQRKVENVDENAEVEALDEAVFEQVTEEQGTEEQVTEERTYTEFIKTEQMTEGSRLTWLAKKYYGEKDLWVFIYEANKDHISNPSAIRIGTPIRIPKLSDELRDVNNPATRQLLDELQAKYLK